MLHLIISDLSFCISGIAGIIAFVKFFNKNAFSRFFCIFIGILAAYELFSGGIHELVPLMSDIWKIYGDFLNILFILNPLCSFVAHFTNNKASPPALPLPSSTPQQHCKGYKADGTSCQIKLNSKDYCHHHEWQAPPHCKGYKADGTSCQIKLNSKDYCHHHEWQAA